MRRTKIAGILCEGFLLTIVSSIALGFVDEPDLYLDAAENPGHPNNWTNLGAAGGQLPRLEGGPKLEPNAGPDNGPAYTADKAGQSFGHAGISLFFADWTIEIWMKRNGPASGGGEHQIFGIMDKPWPFNQAIILRFDDPDSSLVRASLFGADDTDHIAPAGLDVGAKGWHHVALTFDSRNRALHSYLDGKFLRKDPSNHRYDDKVEMKRIVVFRSDPVDPADRALNGSISLVRLYTRMLDGDEISENFRNPRKPQAVNPGDKLTTTWGKLKMLY